MSTSDLIALGQLCISFCTLVLGIIAGVLAILGYNKIIKSADENAKERQAAIDATAERAGKFIEETTQKFHQVHKRDRALIVAFMVIVALMVARLGWRIDNKDKKKEPGA